MERTRYKKKWGQELLLGLDGNQWVQGRTCSSPSLWCSSTGKARDNIFFGAKCVDSWWLGLSIFYVPVLLWSEFFSRFCFSCLLFLPPCALTWVLWGEGRICPDQGISKPHLKLLLSRVGKSSCQHKQDAELMCRMLHVTAIFAARGCKQWISSAQIADNSSLVGFLKIACHAIGFMTSNISVH